MKRYLLSLLQNIINGYVALDPYAANLRTPLLHKTIALAPNELPFPFFLHFTAEKIEVLDNCAQPDAAISGSVFNMALLTRKNNKVAAMKELNIQIQGDTDTAAQFQRFWDSLYIDWEEVVASLLGDPLAVMLGRGARLVQRALVYAGNSLQKTAGEYLQEELLLLPSREEIADFMHDVDKLRSDFDRLEMRLQRLGSTHE